jgi:hypothetical protein
MAASPVEEYNQLEMKDITMLKMIAHKEVFFAILAVFLSQYCVAYSSIFLPIHFN